MAYTPVMNLKNYTKEHGRDDLAKAVGVTPAFIWMVANHTRNASPRLAKLIHAATDRTVSLEELRPDIWGEAA